MGCMNGNEKKIWCMYCKEYIPRSEMIVHHRMHQMVAYDDIKQKKKKDKIV